MRILSAKLACLILFLFCGTTFAHDVGMSSLNVDFSNENLTVSSEYSMREIEKIVPLQNQTELEKLILNSVFVKVDGKIIKAAESKYGFNDGHTLFFQQIFHGIKGEKIELQSLLISKLNPDHKQFLYVRRADEKTVLNEVLSAENNTLVIDFEKLEPNNSVGKFLPLGIGHILFGFDHLLFLFSLLLTVKTIGEIVKIVTSFTIAHSIALSLAALNIIQISPTIVEPLIALSIIFVGLENFFKKQTEKRWILTYFFGLIHGFGFATALQEIGIGTGSGVAVPLLSFNLGVEIGQIAVVLLILPILWKLHKVSFYQNRIVPIGSVTVALAGLYWLIVRIGL